MKSQWFLRGNAGMPNPVSLGDFQASSNPHLFSFSLGHPEGFSKGICELLGVLSLTDGLTPLQFPGTEGAASL